MTNAPRALTPAEDQIIHELDEPFRSRFLLVVYRVRARLHGDPTVGFQVCDSWRNPEVQNRLYRIGRHMDPVLHKLVDSKDPLNPIVTKAPSGLSPHEYRRAAHIALFDATDPHKPWLPPRPGHPTPDKRWYILGEEVDKVDGLKWGGTWADYAHVEAADWRAFAKSRHWVPLGKNERGA